MITVSKPDFLHFLLCKKFNYINSIHCLFPQVFGLLIINPFWKVPQLDSSINSRILGTKLWTQQERNKKLNNFGWERFYWNLHWDFNKFSLLTCTSVNFWWKLSVSIYILWFIFCVWWCVKFRNKPWTPEHILLPEAWRMLKNPKILRSILGAL